eukprot:10719144-Alexandrium_andersonii.AAC.1
MLLRPAIAERAGVYANCHVKPTAPAVGGDVVHPGSQPPPRAVGTGSRMVPFVGWPRPPRP